jgi:hypothetical protein
MDILGKAYKILIDNLNSLHLRFSSVPCSKPLSFIETFNRDLTAVPT